MFTYEAIIQTVTDGDTLRADIDLGFNTWIRNAPLRLAGVNAPELRGETHAAGVLSRDWLRGKLPPGARVVIQTKRDPREKYGRYLATIYLANGLAVNEMMLAEGQAVPYMV